MPYLPSAEVEQLRRELAEANANYSSACQTIAAMHQAALGEIRAPIRGTVEDVADLRAQLAVEKARADALAEELAPFRTTKGIGGYIDSVVNARLDAEEQRDTLAEACRQAEARLRKLDGDASSVVAVLVAALAGTPESAKNESALYRHMRSVVEAAGFVSISEAVAVAQKGRMLIDNLNWFETIRPWVHNQCNGFDAEPYWGLAPIGRPTVYGETFIAAIAKLKKEAGT